MDFAERDRTRKAAMTALKSDAFIDKQMGDLRWRNVKRRTDYLRQLTAKPGAREELGTGAYVPGGGEGLGGEDAGGKARTRKTNRLVGTGARDIIINIGNLIENVTNNNSHYDKNVEAMQEQLTKALLTAVNDVTLLA